MYQFLESLDSTTKGKYFRIFLAPIWLLLEWICYKKYWFKIILPEFIENEEIFSFLDKNDFALKKGKLVKVDLVDDNEFLSGKKPEEIKNIIKREFIETLTKLISENCNTNIENIISLTVTTDTKLTKIDNELYRNNIFEVCIMFCRYWWYEKAKQYTMFWLLVSSIITFVLYFILFWDK